MCVLLLQFTSGAKLLRLCFGQRGFESGRDLRVFSEPSLHHVETGRRNPAGIVQHPPLRKRPAVDDVVAAQSPEKGMLRLPGDVDADSLNLVLHLQLPAVVFGDIGMPAERTFIAGKDEIQVEIGTRPLLTARDAADQYDAAPSIDRHAGLN